MEWLVTAILGLIPIYLFYRLLTNNLNYWKNRGFPHIKGYPLVGNSLDMLLKKRNFMENNTDIYHLLEGEKFGGFMQFQTPMLMIRDPELINQILVKDFVHFHDRGFDLNEEINPLLSSVASLTGDRWRVLRYKMTPTFTSGKLKLMFNSMKNCCEDMINYIENNEHIEARNLVQRFNLQVIAKVSLGIEANTFQHEKAEMDPFFQASTKFFQPNFTQTMKFLMYLNFPKIAAFLRLRILSDEVNNFFTKLVKDTIDHRLKNKIHRNDFLQLLLDLKEQEENHGFTHLISNHEKEDDLEAEDKELLDQLQEAPEPIKPIFSDESIAAQSFMFVSGGSETTASVASFILYELAVNKDVQQKLQEELDSVLSNHDFDYAAVKKMTYLDQVIYEVLRFRPPGGALMRVTTKNYCIPGTDKIVEKGTVISIPVLGLHMNPEYFPDPEKFDPERFKDMNAIPKSVYFPFGAGPRICIAMRFALLEMKIVTAQILSKFNIVLSEKTQLPIKYDVTSFSLHIVGGLWLKFIPRK